MIRNTLTTSSLVSSTRFFRAANGTFPLKFTNRAVKTTTTLNSFVSSHDGMKLGLGMGITGRAAISDFASVSSTPTTISSSKLNDLPEVSNGCDAAFISVVAPDDLELQAKKRASVQLRVSGNCCAFAFDRNRNVLFQCRGDHEHVQTHVLDLPLGATVALSSNCDTDATFSATSLQLQRSLSSSERDLEQAAEDALVSRGEEIAQTIIVSHIGTCSTQGQESEVQPPELFESA